MLELRPEVLRFAEAMELRLRANDWKGGWNHEMPQSLLNRARDEVQELDDVVDEICGMGLSPERIAAVWSEAGDAANFLMMVALVSTAEDWNLPIVAGGRAMARERPITTTYAPAVGGSGGESRPGRYGCSAVGVMDAAGGGACATAALTAESDRCQA